MLQILLIVSSILMTSHCLTVSAGYTVGTRSRDYNPGSYSTSGGFVGLSSSSSGSSQGSSSSSSSSPSSSPLLSKDTHAELTDQLTSSGSYGGAGSHRYSTATGAHSTSGSDDNTQALASGYSSSNADNINSIANPYSNTNTNDIYTSTDVNPYSGSSDNSYASAGHGSPSLNNYASHSIGSDHNSIDYNSYGASSPSSSSGYGPKVGGYAVKSHPHSHGGHFGMKFFSNSHPNYPASNHLNSYSGHIGGYPGGRHGAPGGLGGLGLGSPAALTSHGNHGGPGLSYPGSHGYNDGPRFSGSSSVNYLSNHGSGPGNFIHGGGASSSVHRNIPSFLLGAASSVNPTFVKSPSSFFSGSFGPKAGNKFIIIKDAGGAGPSHLMHPETGGGFSGGMFPGASYKVRSAGPYSAGSASHFPGGNYPSHASHVSSIGYSGSGGHHHAPAAASPATGSYYGY